MQKVLVKWICLHCTIAVSHVFQTSCFLLFSETIHYLTLTQGELNRRRGRQSFSTLCCDVFGLLENQFLRNNNNKGSRSNVNKHELIYGESSSNTPEMHLMSVYHLCYCLQSLLLLLRNSSKTSQQSVRKPYRPLLLFNSHCFDHVLHV